MGSKLIPSAIMIALAHSGMTLAQWVAPASGNYSNVPQGKGQRKANKSKRWG
jgi:hypothetical protein